MMFTPTPIAGCWLIDLDPQRDERGFYARTFCRTEFEQRGLTTHFEQGGISYNRTSGTLRGMHWQTAPHEEAKLIRCTRGSIYDVIIDLRPPSPTYLKWWAIELTQDARRMIYVGEGVAHGFLTLEDHAEVSYQMSAAYRPASARGVRWDDPVLNIHWPFPPTLISPRDRAFPLLEPSFSLTSVK